MKTQALSSCLNRIFGSYISSVPTISPGHLLSKISRGLLLLTCCSSLLYSQAPTKKWDRDLGGTAEESLSKSIPTSDGGYLLAGTSASGIGGERTEASRGGRDYWIVKIDSNGTRLWDKRFGTAADDYLQSVIRTPDGGYLLGGYCDSGISGDRTQASRGSTDYWIVKVSSTGVKQWDRRFGGSENDRLFSLINAPGGGYLLAGLSNSEADGDKTDISIVGDDGSFRNWNDFWLIKIASDGTKLWDNTVGVYEDEVGLASVVPTPDGGYLIGGTRYWLTYEGEQNDITSYEIVKVNSRGTQEWVKFFGGGGEDVLRNVLLTADHGYLLGGSSSSATSPTKTQPSIGPDGDYNWPDYWVIKLDSTGVRQWDRIYGTSLDDQLTSLLISSDGGYLLGGYTKGGLEYDKTEASRGDNDYWLVKIKSNGTKQWDKRFGGSSSDALSSMLTTPTNGLLLFGSSSSVVSGDKTQPLRGGSDFWLVRTWGNELPVACSASGSILRETWVKVPGYTIESIPVNTTPTATRQLTSFEGPSNVTNEYGDRIRGYICPPTSGNYTFWIASDDNSALYFSSNDQPDRKQRIAWVSGATKPQEWTKYASQKSATIYLEAGKKYYIESLHKEASGEDHIAVGWQLPDGTLERPIPGKRLSPFKSTASRTTEYEETELTTSAAFVAYPNPFADQTSIRFTAEVSGKASVAVYDLSGSLVKGLFEGELEAGVTKELTLEGSSLPSGIYLVKATSPAGVSHLKLVLTK